MSCCISWTRSRPPSVRRTACGTKGCSIRRPACTTRVGLPAAPVRSEPRPRAGGTLSPALRSRPGPTARAWMTRRPTTRWCGLPSSWAGYCSVPAAHRMRSGASGRSSSRSLPQVPKRREPSGWPSGCARRWTRSTWSFRAGPMAPPACESALDTMRCPTTRNPRSTPWRCWSAPRRRSGKAAAKAIRGWHRFRRSPECARRRRRAGIAGAVLRARRRGRAALARHFLTRADLPNPRRELRLTLGVVEVVSVEIRVIPERALRLDVIQDTSQHANGIPVDDSQLGLRHLAIAASHAEHHHEVPGGGTERKGIDPGTERRAVDDDDVEMRTQGIQELRHALRGEQLGPAMAARAARDDRQVLVVRCLHDLFQRRVAGEVIEHARRLMDPERGMELAAPDVTVDQQRTGTRLRE